MFVVQFQLKENIDNEEWPEVAGPFASEKDVLEWIEAHQRKFEDRFKYHLSELWM